MKHYIEFKVYLAENLRIEKVFVEYKTMKAVIIYFTMRERTKKTAIGDVLSNYEIDYFPMELKGNFIEKRIIHKTGAQIVKEANFRRVFWLGKRKATKFGMELNEI